MVKTGFSDDPGPEFSARVRQAVKILTALDTAVAAAKIVTCRECNTVLPDDGACPETSDGQHDPDHVTWEPDEDDPPTQRIALALSITVPNDGYDYSVDITGRLEQILSLVLLHPLITEVGTRGATGSGYDGAL